MNRSIALGLALSAFATALGLNPVVADEPAKIVIANANYWKKLDGAWYEIYTNTKEPHQDRRLEWHITKPASDKKRETWIQITDFENEAQQWGYTAHLDATRVPIWLDFQHGRAVFGSEGVMVGIVKIDGDRLVWVGEKASLAEWKKRKGDVPQRPKSFKNDKWGTYTLKRIPD